MRRRGPGTVRHVSRSTRGASEQDEQKAVGPVVAGEEPEAGVFG